MDTIVTHSANGHTDEFLAVAMLANAKHVTKVLRVKHDEVDTYKDKAYLVDVGKEHNPSKGLFDHHQDPNMPAAFFLVADYLDINLNNWVWKYLSDVDTKGPKKAKNSLTEDQLIVADAIFRLLQPVLRIWDKLYPEGKAEATDMRAIGRILREEGYSDPYYAFKEIYKYFAYFYPDTVEESVKELEEEERKKEEVLSKIKYSCYGKYRVAINDSDIYLPLEELGAYIMVTENTRSGLPSIIVDTDVINVNDIVKYVAKNGVETTFVHNNGFMAIFNTEQDKLVKILENAL